VRPGRTSIPNPPSLVRSAVDAVFPERNVIRGRSSPHRSQGRVGSFNWSSDTYLFLDSSRETTTGAVRATPADSFDFSKIPSSPSTEIIRKFNVIIYHQLRQRNLRWDYQPHMQNRPLSSAYTTSWHHAVFGCWRRCNGYAAIRADEAKTILVDESETW
jgi:hypothetical protein